MGVPGFFSWLLRKKRDNKKLIINTPKFIKKNNLLFIDTNCLLHPCVNFIISKVKHDKRDISRDELEDEIFKYISEYINNIIEQTKSEFVYIAIDGVAPMAKILQQRQRRYKYLYEKNMDPKMYLNENFQLEEPDITKYPITSIEITPGTPFMERIDNYLKKYIKSLEEKKIKYIYSSYQIIGEGEHKIIQYIKEQIRDSQIIVYGLDADLLFLTLSIDQKYDNDIYVMREKQVFDNKEIDYNKEIEYNYVDINELQNTIKLLDIKVEDFIILCYIIGNDFLPHMKTIDIRKGGLDKILSSYYDIKKLIKCNLYENNKINHDMLQSIFNKLVWTEQWKKEKSNDDNIKIHFDNKNEYYKYFLGLSGDIDENIIIDMVEKYISGFDWCIEYYTKGCKSWSWGYPYMIAPLISDIVKYYPINILIKKSECKLKPIEQLIIAIPKGTYKYVINEDIIDQIVNNKNIGYLFPENYNIEINKDDKEWKYPVKIPIIGELEYNDYIKEIMKINIIDNKNIVIENYYKN